VLYLTCVQESPHEQQQSLLLSRIITNIVRHTYEDAAFTDQMLQEKLNEAVMVMNRSLQEVNIQNMNVELVAQMFKNYQSNVLFHLEGKDDDDED
jgi:DASH complex subunit DAD4